MKKGLYYHRSEIPKSLSPDNFLNRNGYYTYHFTELSTKPT
jgi:hypothetical protein